MSEDAKDMAFDIMDAKDWDAFEKKGTAMSELKIHVQGHPESTLFFSPGKHGCGDIKNGDGVAFRHGKHGGWVITFASLEKMYLAARRERKATPYPSKKEQPVVDEVVTVTKAGLSLPGLKEGDSLRIVGYLVQP